MRYILIGTTAFIFFFFFDIYTLKNEGVKKKIFGIMGLGTFIYSAVMIILRSDKIEILLPIRISSFVLWLGVTLLLIYSLFLELPFVKTYGKMQHNTELVDTGTYALCRHPGVLWFGFLFLFLFSTTGAVLLIPAGVIWTIIDILYVYLQEKLFFYKIFPEYKAYIKTTPMLIPTRASMKKCIATLYFRRN
jgi:protein-S-isoprenylcysteine O-methyltransferase Ste14